VLKKAVREAAAYENPYFTRMNISGSKTTENNKLTNLTINVNSQRMTK